METMYDSGKCPLNTRAWIFHLRPLKSHVYGKLEKLKIQFKIQ